MARPAKPLQPFAKKLTFGEPTLIADLPGASSQRYRSLLWPLTSRLLPLRGEIEGVDISASEAFDIRAIRHDDGGTLPDGHCLNMEQYNSRPFIRSVGRNVLMTRTAKLPALTNVGVMSDFMVGPPEAWPRDLLAAELVHGDEGWRVKPDMKVERLSGLSIPIGHYGMDTFGHFMLDVLLQVYLHEDMLASGAAYLAHWPFHCPWMAPLLDACGAPASARREVQAAVVLMERASLTSALAGHGVYFPAAYSREFLAWLRGKLIRPACPQQVWKRLYVRRSEARRAVIGQSKLERYLHSQGFEVLDPDAISISAQAQLISESEVIVSAWGSGLALAPLLGGRKEVIELTPLSINDPWFLGQAAVHGLHYTPVPHASVDGSITPNLAAIERVLNRIDAA